MFLAESSLADLRLWAEAARDAAIVATSSESCFELASPAFAVISDILPRDASTEAPTATAEAREASETMFGMSATRVLKSVTAPIIDVCWAVKFAPSAVKVSTKRLAASPISLPRLASVCLILSGKLCRAEIAFAICSPKLFMWVSIPLFQTWENTLPAPLAISPPVAPI
jgi:hypothetical protein